MAWPVFDRIRALAKHGGIQQQDNILQNQPDIDRIIQSGDFYNFGEQQSLLNQTALQVNRLERYKDYDQMDEIGEVSLALDLYADESSLMDPERKHTLVIKAETEEIKEELEDLFFNTLQIDSYVRPMARYLSKYGDAPHEIVPNANRDGIASLKFMNIYNFTRVETKYGDLVGFFYQDEVSEEPTFLHPWQVSHMRLLTYENLYHPYGRSVLEGGRKAFKQLRLMEDSALIYRITRAPEKRLFTIPVGDIPTKEVQGYIEQISRIFKKKRFYDERTGTFNERYSPLIQEDDFWLPQRPDGSGPSVDTLPGAENLDQIADIEYFKKKMIAPLKIPFSRVGLGNESGESFNELLVSSHTEFAKAVQWIQREIVEGLKKVAVAHLALKGCTISQIKSFDISMSATNAIDELYRIEVWRSRAGVMTDLKDLDWFPAEWIVSRFTDLSPDEIQKLEEAGTLKDDEEEFDLGGGGLGGGGAGLDLDLDGDIDMIAGLEGEEGGMDELEAGGMEGMDEVDIEATQMESIVKANKELKYKFAQHNKNRKRHALLKENKFHSGIDHLISNNEFLGIEADLDDYMENESGLLTEDVESDEEAEILRERREQMEQQIEYIGKELEMDVDSKEYEEVKKEYENILTSVEEEEIE